MKQKQSSHLHYWVFFLLVSVELFASIKCVSQWSIVTLDKLCASPSPYLRVHLLQLILQLIQLLCTEALEDGILVDVPGVRHVSWSSGSHTHTLSLIHTTAHPWARRHCDRREERGKRGELNHSEVKWGVQNISASSRAVGFYWICTSISV